MSEKLVHERVACIVRERMTVHFDDRMEPIGKEASSKTLQTVFR
jgi:hypothetical protein